MIGGTICGARGQFANVCSNPSGSQEPSLEPVGSYSLQTGSYDAALFARKNDAGLASESILSQPIFDCAPGEVLFMGSNRQNQSSAMLLELVRPVNLSANIAVVGVPQNQFYGVGASLTVLTPVQRLLRGKAYTVDRFIIRYDAYFGSGTVPCAQLLLSYDVINNVAQNIIQTDSRLQRCVGGGCDPVAATTPIWNYLDASQVFGDVNYVFRTSQVGSFSNESLGAVDVAPGGFIVIDGVCTYNASSWPGNGIGGQQSVEFLFTPGSRLNFGGHGQSFAGYNIAGSDFMPCESTGYDGIVILPRTVVTMYNGSTSSRTLVLGAANGITVKEYAQLELRQGRIIGSTNGLNIDHNGSANLVDVHFGQTIVTDDDNPFGVQYNPAGPGQVGIKVNWTASTTPPGLISANENLLANDIHIEDFATGIDVSGTYEPDFSAVVSNSTIQDVTNGIVLYQTKKAYFRLINSALSATQYGFIASYDDFGILSLEDNSITSGNTAIQSGGGYYTYLEADDNIISSGRHGIVSTGIDPSLYATNNEIVLTPGGNFTYEPRIGVRHYSSTNGQSSISDNEITLPTQQSTGVQMLNSSNTTASNNAIRTRYLVATGLSVVGGQNNVVRCNRVGKFNSSFNSAENFGVVTQSVNGITVQFNTLNHIGYGLQMLGTSYSGQYRRNRFESTGTGLVVGLISGDPNNVPDAYIGGAQSFPGNEWINNTRAYHYPSETIKENNRFDVRSSSPFHPTTGNLANWFYTYVAPNAPEPYPSNCATLPPGWFEVAPPEEEETQVSRSSDSNTELDSRQETSLARDAQRAEARTSKTSGQTSETNPILGELARFESELLKYSLERSDEVNYTMRADALNEFRNSDKNAKASLQLRERYLSIEKGSSSDLDKLASLGRLQAQVGSVASATDLEQLWQEALDLAIQVRKGRLSGETAEQKTVSRLNTIASLCYETKGPGVLLARQFTDRVYEDYVQCQPNKQQLRLSDLPETDLFISPNPVGASSRLTFSRSLIDADIQIVDGTGRVIESRSKFNGSKFRTRNPLASGVYVLRIVDAHGAETSVRLVATGR